MEIVLIKLHGIQPEQILSEQRKGLREQPICPDREPEKESLPVLLKT